jgi:transcriptional regulator with XRE-family HTH domain
MASSLFGARLRELREGAGLTQQQLADRAGLKIGGIRDLEQGINRRPLWDTIQALAEALGVDCRAFQEEPADTSPRGRGRPPKAAAPKKPARSKPRRPRGKK